MPITSILLMTFAASIATLSSFAAPEVSVLRTPENGLQPQAAVDSHGNLHLIYFKGEAAGGDIFYVQRASGARDFQKSVRVNTEARSAMAVGTIRGAQLAFGSGRIHVVWNGPTPKNGTHMDAPMLYTRSNETGTAFERERNLITFARGLDGGGSVAADHQGNVFVFWHASKPGNTNGEPGRAVFVARSRDGGETFGPERLATPTPTGACGCCGMKAFADTQGNLFALFRGAADTLNRDEFLLGGRIDEDLKPLSQHPWKIPMCPMSSASFSAFGPATLAAWESTDNVFFSRIEKAVVAQPIPAPGPVKKKHPAIAANSKGEMMLAWTEGTGWGKGGSVAWQLYSAQGRPVGDIKRSSGLPAWSLVSVVATVDDGFLLIY